MFYDASGSRLFERITELPEYYLTRAERDIVANAADDIVTRAPNGSLAPLRVVELGAGTASKTALVLDAVVTAQSEVLYVPVDVSRDALDIARDRIASVLPKVRVEPVVANYVTHPPLLEAFDGTTLVLYLGSSIGNFSPNEVRAILRNFRFQLQPGDALLLGTDLTKDESVLLAAYDDRDGVTAAFNLNVLHRLNRDLGADFEVANFQHRALWNRGASRIEMHLVSTHDQRVRIEQAGLDLRFAAFETIHTENSYKFTPGEISALLGDAGFSVEQSWTDSREWYAASPMSAGQQGAGQRLLLHL
jgi:dimethylhistidine N-methyltransferase